MIGNLQAHYGFSRMPFGRELAPGMLHRHDAHNQAAARITWCIQQHALGVITGEVGAGKTVALRAAVNGLDLSRYILIYVSNPTVGVRGIYSEVVAGLGGVPKPHHATLVPQALEAIANEHAERGRVPILAIDLCRPSNYADTVSRQGRVARGWRAPGRGELGRCRHSYRPSRNARMLSGGR